MNRTLPSSHGGSLEIMLTVPLTADKKEEGQKNMIYRRLISFNI